MQTILPDAVPSLVRDLRTFLTQSEIDKATAALHAEERSSDLVKRMRLRRVQPWLYGFAEYRKQTLGGRTPKQWSANVLSLAIAGLHVPVVTRNMPDPTRRHHRAMLLSHGGNHASFFAEWTAAYCYARSLGADIFWSQPNVQAADFAVRSPTVEFEVECKRFGSGIVELLGDAEHEALADQLLAVCGQQVHGVLDVNVTSLPMSPDRALARLHHIVRTANYSAAISIAEDGVNITGMLHRSTGIADATTGFQELRTIAADVRCVATASDADGMLVNLRFVRVRGPRRSPQEFQEYLLEKMSGIAESQFSGNMGGVMVIEFGLINDPTTFRDSDGLNSVLNELFRRHRHLAAIILRSASTSKDSDQSTQIEQFAYVQKSAVTNFPAVSALSHLGT